MRLVEVYQREIQKNISQKGTRIREQHGSINYKGHGSVGTRQIKKMNEWARSDPVERGEDCGEIEIPCHI